MPWRRDAKIRHATRWYYRMGRRVWFHEIRNFLFRDRRVKRGPTLEQFWGAPQDAEEEALSRLDRNPVTARAAFHEESTDA